MLEYLLLSTLGTENTLIKILAIIFLIPALTYLTSYIKDAVPDIMYYFNNYGWNTIDFKGFETLRNGVFYIDYPYPMLAICHWLNSHNKTKNIEFKDLCRNHIFYCDYLNESDRNSKTIKNNFIIKTASNMEIIPGILFDCNTKLLQNGSDDSRNTIYTTVFTVKSKKYNTNYIFDFVNQIIDEYKLYERSLHRNKQFHFIYQSLDEEKLIFSKNAFVDTENNVCNYETFDTIYSEHKDSIIRTVNRLTDIDYFKRTGNRQKAGFLFYGPPGCGKTSHVIALANYTKRHIIEIPLSRVKTNEEIEQILSQDKINGIEIKNSEIILLFDEIDQLNFNDLKTAMNMPMTFMTGPMENSDSPSKKNKKSDDKINLGCLLSRLDGVGNYNGLIIIATTNHIEKLPDALYRDGRLTPVYFDYCNRKDIVNIIEHNYSIKLSDSQKALLPDREQKLAYSSLKKYIDRFENNLDGLIDYIKNVPAS